MYQSGTAMVFGDDDLDAKVTKQAENTGGGGDGITQSSRDGFISLSR